jgi:peptidylprolyl isomerase domain and WD repeat-containing protein 1
MSSDSKEPPSEEKSLKRKGQDEGDEDDDDWVGPMPSEAAPVKKKKVLEHEKLYLGDLPKAGSYERSFMHRDTVTFTVATKTEFIITASNDGHVKFWKKQQIGVEFVKHFRAHMASIQVSHYC